MCYYLVITDNNTKSVNIGSHSEFQDGRQVLNNTRLNYVYNNEGLKPMSNYLLIMKVKIWQKRNFANFTDAILKMTPHK